MRVSIAGAGNVGRYIARELIDNGHQVLIIDRDPEAIEQIKAPQATWLLADACELDSITEAHLETCDVAIAATGDDKSNLVHSLLAKTEFGVPRTVARVNHPANDWLFDEVWGVDVAVSTPRIMCALAEEAVTVGDLVRLFRFTRGNTDLVEMTLPESSPCVGAQIGDLQWPADSVLVALIRDGRGLVADREVVLEPSDELLFLAPPEAEAELGKFLSPDSEVRGAEAQQTPQGPRTPPPVMDRLAAPEQLVDYVL